MSDRPSVTDKAAGRAETTTDDLGDAYMLGYAAAKNAETTTATDEDAVERVFQTTHPAPNTVMGWIRAGYEAGLLATARTRPTRDAVILALAQADGQTWPDGMDPHTANHMYGKQADAVLALLNEEAGR